MYVYKQTEPGLWTVGFYDPTGKWVGDSDHESSNEAANRVHWLNGGLGSPDAVSEERFQALTDRVDVGGDAYVHVSKRVSKLVESLNKVVEHINAEEFKRNGGQPDKPEPAPTDHHLIELLTERVSAAGDAYCRLDKRVNEIENHMRKITESLNKEIERFNIKEFKRNGG